MIMHVRLLIRYNFCMSGYKLLSVYEHKTYFQLTS